MQANITRRRVTGLETSDADRPGACAGIEIALAGPFFNRDMRIYSSFDKNRFCIERSLVNSGWNVAIR